MADQRTPQQERSQARRTVILAAAAEVFDRVGFGSASLSEIAKQAEVGQGLIYFYFRTKEAIALAVIEEQNRRTFESMSSGEDDVRTPMVWLIEASRSIGELLLTDPIVRAGIRLSLEQGVFAEPTSEFYDDWIKGVIDGFAAAQGSGELRDVVPVADLGASVVAYFTGVQLVSNVRNERKDLMRSLETMWAILLNSVVADDARERLTVALRETFGADRPHGRIASDAVT